MWKGPSKAARSWHLMTVLWGHRRVDTALAISKWWPTKIPKKGKNLWLDPWLRCRVARPCCFPSRAVGETQRNWWHIGWGLHGASRAVVVSPTHSDVWGLVDQLFQVEPPFSSGAFQRYPGQTQILIRLWPISSQEVAWRRSRWMARPSVRYATLKAWRLAPKLCLVDGCWWVSSSFSGLYWLYMVIKHR